MKKKLTIEVELTHGYITEQEVEVDIPAYTMASKVAFDVMRELKGNCFGVYMTLLSHRNMKNNQCFPSRETIMKETGLSEGTVKDCLTKLHKAGYIIINSGYFGCSNNYYFPKEWFYDLFAEDINQIMAKRKTGGQSALKADRETKKDKKIKEQNQEIMELKKELAKLKGTKATKKTAPIELNDFDDEDGTDPF